MSKKDKRQSKKQVKKQKQDFFHRAGIWLRANEKPVLILIIFFSFIGFGIGGSIMGLFQKRQSRYAVRVKNEDLDFKIKHNDLLKVHNRLFEPMAMMQNGYAGKIITWLYYPESQNVSRDYIINRIIQLKEAKAAGIIASEKEVDEMLIKLPKYRKYFQDYANYEYQYYCEVIGFQPNVPYTEKGSVNKFRASKFKKELSRRKLSEVEFRKNIEEEVILRKYRLMVAASMLPTAGEVCREWNQVNHKVTGAFFRLSAKDFIKDVDVKAITDEELRKHYNEVATDKF